MPVGDTNKCQFAKRVSAHTLYPTHYDPSYNRH